MTVFASRALVAALLLVVPTLSRAQGATIESGPGGDGLVVASVTRSSRIPADRMQMTVMIESTGENAAESVQRATVKAQAVATAIRAAILATGAVTTMPLPVAPTADWNGFPGAAVANSFTSRMVIRVQLDRIDQLMSLSAAALTAGANWVLNPLYESSQAEATRKGLEGEALLAVRAQAEALATGLSGRLGRLVEVSSITPSSPQVFDQGFPYSYIENFNGQSTPLPEVTVRASVTLRYKFMPR